MQDRIDAARAANKLSYDKRIYFLHQMQAEMDEILNNPSLKAAHNAALDARTNIVFDLRGMGSIRISNESLEAYERALMLAVVPITPPQVFKSSVIPKAVSTYAGDIKEPESLPQKASKRGITMPTFDNMFPPMSGGAGLLTGFESPTQVPPGLQGVYQELVSIRSAIPSMGSAVVNAANQGALAQAQVQLAGQIKQQINDLNRLAIQYAGQVNAKPLEAQLVELNKRSFGMQASLGGYGATQYSAIGSVLDPIRDMTDRMRQGEKITQYQQQEVMRQASYDRARIALDPHLAESVKRNYSSAIATEQRRLQDIGRFNVLELPRGMPDEGIAGRFPGMMDRFQGMQGIRQRIEAARDATGRLRDDEQRSLRAELDIEQRLLRVNEQRIRAAGDMTKEVQHQFNVQNSEINRSRRDLERAPTVLTPGGATRMAAMRGGLALFGEGLQQLAFERGDVGGTGAMSMVGGLLQQRGIRGALIGGAEALGARGALGLAGKIAGAPLTGSAAGIVGGLGSMAMLPLVGGFLAAAGGVLSQVGPSTQHGMEVERLYRAGGAMGFPGMEVGHISPNFISGYYREILNAAQNQGPGTGGDLAYSRDQVLGVAGTLAATGGTFAGGRAPLGRDRLRSVLEFSRYMGTDTQATAAQFGRQEAIGNVDTKRFADLLANSIAQTGLRGREQEVLGAVTDLTTTIARRGGTVSENQTMTGQVMGLLTAIGSTGVPGLQGAMGAQALGRMDQSITGATGIQRALLYGMYRNQPGGPQDFNQFIYEQGLGVGSQFAPGAINQTMGLAGGNADMGGILIGQMFGLTPQQGRALAQLSKDNRLTNESMNQVLNTGGGVAGVGQPLQGGTVANLGNAESLSDAMNRLENTFEDMASALQSTIATLTNTVTQFAGIGTRIVELATNIFGGDVSGAATAIGGLFAPGSQIVPPPGGRVTPPGGAETSPITPVPAYPPTPAPPEPAPGGGQFARPGAIYGPSRGFPGYFLPVAEGGFAARPGAGGTQAPSTPGIPTLPPAPEPNLPGPGAPPLPAPESPAQQLPSGLRAEEFIPINQNIQGSGSAGQGVTVTAGDICGPSTLAAILSNALGINVGPYDILPDLLRFIGQSPGGPPGSMAFNRVGLAWGDVAGFVNKFAQDHGSALRATQGTRQNPLTPQQSLEGLQRGQPTLFSLNQGTNRAGVPMNRISHIRSGHIMGAVRANERTVTVFDPAGGGMKEVPIRDYLDAASAGFIVQTQNYAGRGSGDFVSGAPSLPSPAPSENAITGGSMIPGLIAQVPRGEPLDVGFGPGMLPRLSGEGGSNAQGPIASPREQATYFRLATQMALAAGLTPNEAMLAVAMGASESNFGNAPTNNILGMKAWPGWVNRGGNVLDQTTWEVRPGNANSVEQGNFVAFQSHWDAFRAFSPLLGESMVGGARERIAAAVRAGTMTPAQAAEALSGTAYQTDPRWPANIRGLVDRVRPYLPGQEGPQGMVPDTGLYGSVPMGADALGAQQQMFMFAFQPATITLVDASGNYLGQTQIMPQRTDAQELVDRDLSVSSNGYTNSNAVYTGGI